MATERPQHDQPDEAPAPPAAATTPPQPTPSTAPIETLYAAGPGPAPSRPETAAGTGGSTASTDPAAPGPAAGSAAGAAAAGAGRGRWWSRGLSSGERWSGRRTVAVVGLALLLGGAGAAAVAAAIPDGAGMTNIGGPGGRGGPFPGGHFPGGGQLPGGQLPGAPNDLNRDGDDAGPGNRDFRGGQPPQDQLHDGQQQDSDDTSDT